MILERQIERTAIASNEIPDVFRIPSEFSSFIEIYTNNEAKPTKDCSWFYLVFDEEELFETVTGNAKLCNCEHCLSYGAELYEFYSIFQALSAVWLDSPNTSITLWYSSEKFFSDYDEGILSYAYEAYGCPFLQTLGQSIKMLLSKLDVEFLHYSYVNKDSITQFF